MQKRFRVHVDKTQANGAQVGGKMALFGFVVTYSHSATVSVFVAFEDHAAVVETDGAIFKAVHIQFDRVTL